MGKCINAQLEVEKRNNFNLTAISRILLVLMSLLVRLRAILMKISKLTQAAICCSMEYIILSIPRHLYSFLAQRLMTLKLSRMLIMS